jgi:hypothetical protein
MSHKDNDQTSHEGTGDTTISRFRADFLCEPDASAAATPEGGSDVG